jgi:hypothetical protein
VNHEDLERQLRAERGPREAGYSPTNLPASLSGARSPGAGPSRLVRVGAFAGVAAAGALAVALLGGVFSGSHRGVGDTTSSAPSASQPAGLPDCRSADVTLTAEPWGGAAGSRGTNVTVTLTSDRPDCMLSPVVGGLIIDATEQRVVSIDKVTSGAPQGGSVPLKAGASYTVGVAWSDWCGPQIAEPIGLALHFEGWGVAAAVSVASGGTDPVPPCNGGSLSNLSVTALQAN